MRKTIIWGTESTGVEICTKILSNTYSFDNHKREILFFVDSNHEKWDKNIKILGTHTIPIKQPSCIAEFEFDEIIIASPTGYKEILCLIKQLRIQNDKINFDYCLLTDNARKSFLENLCKKNPQWHNADTCVAELGVFQGDFAKEINQYFPHNNLYLFDTFDGFDQRDLASEDQYIQKLGKHLSNTSIEIVMDKMPYPQKIRIKQGWFPQSCYNKDGGDVVNKKFCFVNIDTDLHDSILAGLDFFYPRMIYGGVILIHDYFSFFYTGVKKAVDFFCDKHKLIALPIGDMLSVAIIKNKKL